MTMRDEIEDDKPLDPATEQLRRKLVRLLVFSMGFLILSIMTVFGVIIYKTTGQGEPDYDGSPIAIDLPNGAEIIDTAFDGGSILLTVRVGTTMRLFVVSRTTGEIQREFRTGPSEPASSK